MQQIRSAVSTHVIAVTADIEHRQRGIKRRDFKQGRIFACDHQGARVGVAVRRRGCDCQAVVLAQEFALCIGFFQPLLRAAMGRGIRRPEKEELNLKGFGNCGAELPQP